MTIHSALESERQRQKINPAQLARQSGLPPMTVYDFCRGRRTDPNVNTLLALLAGLGRDLKWLHNQGIRPAKNNSEKVTD